MISDWKKYMEFLIDKKLTPNQFAICWMVETKDVAHFRDYQKIVGPFKDTDYQYLIDNDYIVNLNVDGTLNIASLITTPKFSEEIFIDNRDALEEILEIYPTSFRDDNGKPWSLLNTDLGQLSLAYGKIIKGNRYKHEDILAKTIIMVERMRNNETNYRGIGKYITGENWREVKANDEDNKPRDSFTSL